MNKVGGMDTHVGESMGSVFRRAAQFFLMLMMGMMVLLSAGLLMMQFAHG
ncbi:MULTISPECIES: hypothetical protein [Pseudomonas]|nr:MULTISPECIES: hypothetical protein [Pseudomonas]MEB6587678.1 hypothetical protein [Pseudomonas asiatica]